jgi:hypothetical protein
METAHRLQRTPHALVKNIIHRMNLLTVWTIMSNYQAIVVPLLLFDMPRLEKV